METEQKDINQEEKKEEATPEVKLRQVVIETDGNMIRMTKNETAGELELSAILSTILAHIKNKK
jgi:hypothetical protein